MDNKSNKDINDLSFETALAELESIVIKLESGKVNLDDAINFYTRGNILRGFCDNKLKEAKTKIEQISVDNNIISAKDFV